MEKLNTIKVILISQIPLPYSKVGSWSTLYKNYFNGNHKVDYIICEKPKQLYSNLEYEFIKDNFFIKIESKIKRNSKLKFFKALYKIIKPNQKYIIQVIDDFEILRNINKELVKNNVRDKVYLQFFYHGFHPYYNNDFKGLSFFQSIDEMVLLTNDSYKLHKEYYTTLPCYFSVIHNGIDKSLFFKISDIDKVDLKKQLNFNANKTFIWCSQNRPKKGLKLMLSVWKELYTLHDSIELIVIGVASNEKIDGVTFLGLVPNVEIPKYLQAADCYLFPTLWKEGFGLSLIEALSCGCFCIASNIGGVAEVLNYGEYGQLIQNPHYKKEWIQAINNYLSNQHKTPFLPIELYSKENWEKDMNSIIDQAKKNF